MNQTLTIRVPDELKRELEEIGRAENKPISDIVRDSIRRYVAIQRFHRLRNIVLPFAEANGILSDEDVFKIIS